MDSNSDIMAIARAAIEEFGGDAARVMQRRADDHRAAKEEEGAVFWQHVADAVRKIQGRTGH